MRETRSGDATTRAGDARGKRAPAEAQGRRTPIADARRGDGSPSDSDLERLALAAKALADPARLRMLALMVQGRSCCGLPDSAARGVPGRDDPRGICVCELQSEVGLGQSTTSYHLRVLRDAGLVREEPRGKWTFYELDREAAAAVLAQLHDLLRA
jgi:ArsR family transcriptional regulator, arsenate/arsenite/antimonite-responsive transcriptional repressor